MATDSGKWFDELTPPPGGADRLLQRLEQAGRPDSVLAPRIALAGMTAAALALALILFALDREEDPTESRGVVDIHDEAAFDRLLGRPVGRDEFVVAVDEQPVEVSELESSNPRIRMYRVD